MRQLSAAPHASQGALLLAGIVSGKARRYKQGGFDLDLAYITDHVIAMSYPFEGRRGVPVCHVFCCMVWN